MSKMECIAVQKHPMAETKVVIVSDSERDYGESRSKCRRLCSQDRHDIFIGILLLLLLLSFLSQCALFMYMRGIRNELETLKSQVNYEEMHDVISAKSLSEFLNEKDQLAKQRRRKERSHDCTNTPHFYMKGIGKEDVGQNRILWDGSNGIDTSGSGDFNVSRFLNRVAAVQIKSPGVYFIHVQISIYGRIGDRFPRHPTVGFVLSKTSSNTNIVLSKALLTQDEKGVRYGGTNNERPRDTLSVSGLFYLNRADQLTVEPLGHQLNDHRIQYEIDAETSQFGGFLVQGRHCTS